MIGDYLSSSASLAVTRMAEIGDSTQRGHWRDCGQSLKVGLMAPSAADQKVLDDVATHDWHCMNVGAGDGEPNFSYSVGWQETLKSPEAVVFSLPSELQHSMLWEIFRQIQNGLVLSDGLRIANLIDDYDCIARPVYRSRISDYLGFALWHRRLKGTPWSSVQAFQIFWPGKHQGLFPWESGCDQAVRDGQPLLYLPKETGTA